MNINEEDIKRAKKGFTDLKIKSYSNLINHCNPNTNKGCVTRIEKAERIGLKGIELSSNPKRPNGMMDILVAHGTNNKAVDVLISLAIEYNLSKEIKDMIQSNIQTKYVSGFRNNLTTLLLNVYFQGGSYLIQNDKVHGVDKAQSLQNEVMGIAGTLGEKKCLAFEKRLKRLKGKMANHIHN